MNIANVSSLPGTDNKIGRLQGSQTSNDTCASIPSKENPAYIHLLYPENRKVYYAQKDGSVL